MTARTIGFLLLWGGFFAAALATVFRTEITQSPWMTIPWIWYGGSLAIGFVGVALLRSTSKVAQQHSERIESQLATLTSSMDSLLASISDLRRQEANMEPHEILHYIDQRCATAFDDFADSRRSMIHRFGLQAYADVMTPFASAERYTNRAWSAAADGYVEEVSDSLERAEQYLKKANMLLVDLGVQKE